MTAQRPWPMGQAGPKSSRDHLGRGPTAGFPGGGVGRAPRGGCPPSHQTAKAETLCSHSGNYSLCPDLSVPSEVYMYIFIFIYIYIYVYIYKRLFNS